MGKRVCVLLSGGLDSAMLIQHYLDKGARVQPIYLKGGLRWERVELYWARRFLTALSSRRVDPLRVLSVEQRDLYPRGHWALTGRPPGRDAPDESVYLRGRNILLLSKAAVFCSQERIEVLGLAVLGMNPFPDGKPSFFRAMEAALSIGLAHRIRVETPFRWSEKHDLVRAHRDLPLGRTFSCIQPSGRLHCGRCVKCDERMKYFRKANVPDPTRYRRMDKRPAWG